MPSQSGTADNQGDGSVETVSKMALYDLSRAERAISSLGNKPKWSLADTESFDCMHYNGNGALDICAQQLALKPGQQVIDVGSGFNASGRYLAAKYGANVTGIELQAAVHKLAELITQKNEDPHVVAGVRSMHADFLAIDEATLEANGTAAHFDHLVSFLCVTHMPKEARKAMFRQAARFVKPGGCVYLEDFYNAARSPGSRPDLTDAERQTLRDTVSSPYLPTAEEWKAVLSDAGFGDIQFEDVSKEWKPTLRDRSNAYKATENPDPDLEHFYDTMADLFESGNFAGARIRATRI